MGTAVLALQILFGWALWIWSLRVEGKDPTAKKKKRRSAQEELEAAAEANAPGAYPARPQHREPPAPGGWQSY